MSELNMQELATELKDFFDKFGKYEVNIKSATAIVTECLEEQARKGETLGWELSPHETKSGVPEHFCPEKSVEGLTFWELTYYQKPFSDRMRSSYDHDRFPEREYYSTFEGAVIEAEGLEDDYEAYAISIHEICNSTRSYLATHTLTDGVWS